MGNTHGHVVIVVAGPFDPPTNPERRDPTGPPPLGTIDYPRPTGKARQRRGKRPRNLKLRLPRPGTRYVRYTPCLGKERRHHFTAVFVSAAPERIGIHILWQPRHTCKRSTKAQFGASIFRQIAPPASGALICNLRTPLCQIVEVGSVSKYGLIFASQRRKLEVPPPPNLDTSFFFFCCRIVKGPCFMQPIQFAVRRPSIL